VWARTPARQPARRGRYFCAGIALGSILQKFLHYLLDVSMLTVDGIVQLLHILVGDLT